MGLTDAEARLLGYFFLFMLLLVELGMIGLYLWSSSQLLDAIEQHHPKLWGMFATPARRVLWVFEDSRVFTISPVGPFWSWLLGSDREGLRPEIRQMADQAKLFFVGSILGLFAWLTIFVIVWFG